MTPDHWQKIERLCQAALERPEKERAAFLDQACAGDAALRDEVGSLLAQGEHGASFIESPALEVAAKALARDESPEDCRCSFCCRSPQRERAGGRRINGRFRWMATLSTEV